MKNCRNIETSQDRRRRENERDGGRFGGRVEVDEDVLLAPPFLVKVLSSWRFTDGQG